MKILFILDLYKPHIGGVEILFENLITGLTKKGNEIIILTSRYDKSLEKHEKLDKNIEIYRVGHNRYDFMFYSLKKGLKLAKKVDIIHTTTYNSAIPASIIGIISRKKVVLTVHEIFGQLWYKFLGFKGFFYKVFEALIFKFPFNKYICVSNYTKNSLRVHFGIKDDKLVTIYNGIDYEFWNKNNFNESNYQNIKKELGIENNYVGLFYGRAGISKGLEFYIQAIPDIVKYIKDFKAVIITPNSPNNPIYKIKEMINALDINKYIVLIPGVKNKELPNYILASDFVIIPSLAEGFGFAGGEVSALGQQLITTNVAAIPEVASGKVNFIEPGNVDDITEKVI
ncbi:MAG: glycosyltransferase family 4 protein, partial [Candidatus Gracilibacteria bacterium]|nr:glycosyltransferase family 4 protein [Candidatus Gracilibacteria bacterium]